MDQLLFNRPVPGYAQYRSPVHGLYMCGSSTHPGGGVMGAPGANAAARRSARSRAGGLQRWRARYDCIVIGGGHNGLVCAAYLARGGRTVLVLEAADAGSAAPRSRANSRPAFASPPAPTCCTRCRARSSTSSIWRATG